MARDLAASRELAWRLLRRNLSSRYRHTLLGYAWAFLPPIMTAGVFVFLQKAGHLVAGEMAAPYPVFVLVGLVLWQAFADAVQAPLRLVQQSQSLLTKINFPRESLILAAVGEVIFAALVRLGLLALAFAWFDVGVSWSGVLFPLGMAALIGMGTALGLVLTPAAILYHDVGHALPLFLYLWMFLTPVAYAPHARAAATWLAWLNPVSPLLDASRRWLLSGAPEHLSGFFTVGGLVVCGLFAGWLLYRLALPILIERMSS
jgi:lipopolysaccharide transport system permease protein